jgi:peptidyl-prolyl cis-trans isomerase SurA
MARLLALLSLLLLTPPVSAQAELDEPLPDGVVARLNGDDIPKQTYLDYLYQRFGKRGVREMIGDILVEREASRYSIVIDDLEVKRLADEREEAARRGMDEADFLANLERNGQDYALYRVGLEIEMRNELRLSALVRKTRVATDEKIDQLFERQYGLGGVRMRVRHIVAMPNILRAETVRGGAEPKSIDMEDMRVQARALAEDARARIAQGEEFAAVAAALSHDRVSKDRGGEIQNYNGRLYGPGFRDALNQLEVGQVSAVVESGAGFHVVELLERSETSMAEVREALIDEILNAEPNFQEMAGLRNALIDGADLRLF